MPRKLKKVQFAKERNLIAIQIKFLVTFLSINEREIDQYLNWGERQQMDNFMSTADKLIDKLESKTNED